MRFEDAITGTLCGGALLLLLLMFLPGVEPPADRADDMHAVVYTDPARQVFAVTRCVQR